jgi:ankyrin repeat protein
MAHSVATTGEICVEACAHTGSRPIVEFLLENGSPYSLPTAVMMNDMATVKRYLDEDPHRIHERGAHDFALMWYPVIGKCPSEMMDLLIQRGGKVEQQHFLGTTALHWAVARGNMELVELLIANEADVNRSGRKFSPQGETPLMMARDPKIIRLLKENGAG